jgi:hypothetical protein
MESSPMTVVKESMNKFIKKGLYLVAAFNYPKVKKEYRYHIRENYFCRLNQIQFFKKDYLQKKKYKVIDFQGEFDQEIRYVIPFAYWHFLNGTLAKTVSCKNTGDFYFFSENHEEKYTERVWQKSYDNYDVPNMTHSASFSYKKWARVPFKKHYANDTFKFEKPILVIANKYNIEWDQPPINFYSIDLLDTIISALKKKFQVVYNRPLSTQIVSDNSDILDLHEYEWLKKNHPDVILMNDLFSKHRAGLKSFNQLQMQVYSNCNHFISVHGGTAALASCFEGTNIILSKCGIEHDLGEYNTIMPALSGAKILHAKTESDVLKFISQYYL